MQSHTAVIVLLLLAETAGAAWDSHFNNAVSHLTAIEKAELAAMHHEEKETGKVSGPRRGPTVFDDLRIRP